MIYHSTGGGGGLSGKHRRRTRGLPVALTAIGLTAVVAGVLSGERSPVANSGGAFPVTRESGRPGAVGPEAETPPRSPTPGPRRFTLAASGDVLIHEGPEKRAQVEAGPGEGYDFRPMFARVRPILSSADLAICHLETPLSPDNTDISSYPRFNVPHELADALSYAGYDACSTASNHSLDRERAGVVSTLDALDAAQVRHMGTSRSAGGRKSAILRVRGVNVALLSYTYALNGHRSSGGLVNMMEETRILRDARRARSEGAEFVVVSLHWGLEYQTEPRLEQRTLARALLRSAAVDLILGHHAHVVQPIGRVGSKYVVFGMGNFLSGMDCCPESTQDGVIVMLSVQERQGRFQVTQVRYAPTWVRPLSYTVLPVRWAIRHAEVSPELRQALVASRRRTVTAIGGAGVELNWG